MARRVLHPREKKIRICKYSGSEIKLDVCSINANGGASQTSAKTRITILKMGDITLTRTASVAIDDWSLDWWEYSVNRDAVKYTYTLTPRSICNWVLCKKNALPSRRKLGMVRTSKNDWAFDDRKISKIFIYICCVRKGQRPCPFLVEWLECVVVSPTNFDQIHFRETTSDGHSPPPRSLTCLSLVVRQSRYFAHFFVEWENWIRMNGVEQHKGEKKNRKTVKAIPYTSRAGSVYSIHARKRYFCCIHRPWSSIPRNMCDRPFFVAEKIVRWTMINVNTAKNNARAERKIV